MDDGLPQSICQSCVNSIINCLDFRRQCKDAETQLLIMTNRNEINKHIVEVKTELIDDIDSEMITTIEPKFNLSIENIAIKYEGNISEKTEREKFNYLVKNSHDKYLVRNTDIKQNSILVKAVRNTDNKQNSNLVKAITSNESKFLENTTIKYERNNSEKTECAQFNNLKSSNSKKSLNKDLLQNTDNEQNNHIVACELCKSIKEKFDASTKQCLPENSAFMCKKCKINLNKRHIGKHRKNKPIENNFVLKKNTDANDILHNSFTNKSETVNYCKEILKSCSMNDEFGRDKIKKDPDVKGMYNI